MSTVFVPIQYDLTNVGKIIKSSKKKHLWVFMLETQNHQIELFVSRVSGKRSVFLDGYIYSKHKKSSEYYGSYPVIVGKITLVVFEEENNTFDLRIGNYSFSKMFKGLKNPFRKTKSSKTIVDRKVHKSMTHKEYHHNGEPKTERQLLDLDFLEAHKEAKEGERSPQIVRRNNPFDDLIEIEITENALRNQQQARRIVNAKQLSPVIGFNSCESSPQPLDIFSEFHITESFQKYYSPK